MGIFQNTFDATRAEWVDFPAVKAASLRSIEMLVGQWLPDGKRRSNEWVALNPTRGDNKPGSFSINLKTGRWSDFATGQVGSDMIDLLGYLRGLSPVDAAREISGLLGVPLSHSRTSGKVHPFPQANKRVPTVLPPIEVTQDPQSLPLRTRPDRDGLPRFVTDGDQGPIVRNDELRRHIYRIGNTPVKIKIMRKVEKGATDKPRAMIWYRVRDGEIVGWQSKKPEGWKDVPFIGPLDPFDPDNAGMDLFWPEGEKDTENCARRGLAAFSFGGGEGIPAGAEEYARGRHLVILADNDHAGIKHAEKKAVLAAGIAASVRIVQLPDLALGQDVSDWFDRGGTPERLREIVTTAPLVEEIKLDLDQQPNASADGLIKAHTTALKATAYSWIDPETLPKRDFVYGRHLIRKFVSATVAPGGVGKSSLITTEVLAMVSGISLLDIQPSGRCRVWLWNLEDPRDEIARHIQATAKYFRLKPSDIDGHLFVDSGRDQRLVTAVMTKDGVMILQPVIDNLVAEIIAREIDVLIVDPFVSSHEASENDNGAMDAIVKAWGRVAQLGNCAIELVHHARKNTSGDSEITVESSRGGKALTDGCRSVRVLNRMSESEANEAGVENARLHFRTYVDKGNLAPPAEHSDWFKLESVDLGNGTNGGFGDSVGVVTPWKWPDLMSDVTAKDVLAAQDVISKGRYRSSVQAADWVGKAVAQACHLDLSKPGDKSKAKHMLKVWLASGALKEETQKDDRGNDRPFIVVGEWAT